MAGFVGLLAGLMWGALLAGAGLVVATGAAPGSASWDLGPRIGIASLLIVTGLLIASFSIVPWFIRRTTKAEDYKGGCPVGATCGCGHFNFKPRATCRQCGKATEYAA